MLRNRLITGVLVGAFFLLVLLAGSDWLRLLLLLGVYSLAYWEFEGMARSGGLSIHGSGAFICGALYLVAAVLETPQFSASHPGIPTSMGNVRISDAILWLTPAVLLCNAVLKRRTDRALESFGVALVAFWYTAVLLSFLPRVAFNWLPVDGRVDWTGRLMLVYGITVVKLGDVGAFSIGSRFGSRIGGKLIPEISPAKSRIGLAGAYLGSVGISLVIAVVAKFCNDGILGSFVLTYPRAIVVGIMLATVGAVGDLGESLFKRSLGVKDSGGGFPGMGGFLDVVDSLLFSAPFFFLYIQWVLR